ncbi:MAG TPA: YciI family protein [Terriglobales bacterium]|nr:YciI family protein [Terriglobales bacterium]
MRFMLLIKANQDSEAGVMPSRELVEAMGAFNGEMAKAGVLLAGEGLQPSSRGARVRFSGGKRTVIDGPFTETKELIAGFWLIQVKSLEEAIEWARRCPAPMGEGVDAEIEVRQVFETEDFPPEVMPAEAAASEIAMREELQRRYTSQ